MRTGNFGVINDVTQQFLGCFRSRFLEKQVNYFVTLKIELFRVLSCTAQLYYLIDLVWGNTKVLALLVTQVSIRLFIMWETQNKNGLE